MTPTEQRIIDLVDACHFASHKSKNSEAKINVIPVVGMVTSQVVELVIEEMKQYGYIHIIQKPEDDGSITISFTTPKVEP
jgi:hypothetical protein